MAGKARRYVVWRSIPRQQNSKAMQNDNHLRAQQHQNELNAFRRYEQRFWLAYAKSQNPYPPRWIGSDHSRRISRHCQLDALD